MKPITELDAVRAYLERIEATVVSIRSAVIREYSGRYYRDVHRITFGSDGEIKAPAILAPTNKEVSEIKTQIASSSIPEHIPATSLRKLPFKPSTRDLFIFNNSDKHIIMIQERIITKDGEKRYMPWTYWSDNKWRQLEPEDNLPLYNAESLNSNEVVFIHEGPKSVRDLIDMLRKGKHPWQSQLENAAHVGWIGGALNPYRTDWNTLAKAGITRAYIVADNDKAGLSAIRHISKFLKCVTWSIQFNEHFPSGFDLGDNFPKTFFKHNFYNGPSFHTLLHPSTWMTEEVPRAEGDKGRPSFMLRKNAEDVWSYCEGSDQFVLGEVPNIIRSEQVLNKMLMPFSHVDNTCRLICKAQLSRKVNLCYRPDTPKLMIEADGTSAINTHIGCRIPSHEGDATPFIDLIWRLIPNKNERRIVEKWIATIIAKPTVRIGFALLMISEKQGIGKTTLGNHILAPLVGHGNSSYPRESDIISDYNEWVAHKRLVLANEIYLGSGWKAYQVLQGAITDNKITVNKKYVRQYEVDNWCHIYACSNSIRALKISREDRRWFVPKMCDTKQDQKYWKEFYNWLSNGGLSFIKNWAEKFGDYLTHGEHAPTSILKKEMIEDSESEAWKEARILGGVIDECARPVAVCMRDIMNLLRHRVRRDIHESDAEIRCALRSEGASILPERVKIDGALQYVAGNSLLLDELARIEGGQGERRAYTRAHRANPADLVNEPM